ncbi:DinB family protein [Flavobacterium phycosphaerae]|uniref:DinB family protein n=1 Tax=Flavobacterium phycosphaerae TaxID=2697515 RepID=UPI001F26937C|nr:DinB family protein [Flavobacterium phycosphaerae]
MKTNIQKQPIMLIPAIHKTLNELTDLLSQLSDDDYCCPCHDLSNATIGEHTRHIIEMFQCLESQYESGTVNYDKRQRDYRIQTNSTFAQNCIADLLLQLGKPNKKLYLQQLVDNEELLIESNYHRELLYNLEHCIHHQALIKVALIQSGTSIVDDNFGVARSTIEYRKQCAQ